MTLSQGPPLQYKGQLGVKRTYKPYIFQICIEYKRQLKDGTWMLTYKKAKYAKYRKW